MSKSTKKRTVIYSNVKSNKKLIEEKNKMKNEQINLNDEVIIGFNSKKNGNGNGSDIKVKKKDNDRTKKQNRQPKKGIKKNTPSNSGVKNITEKKEKVVRKRKTIINKNSKLSLLFKISTVAIIIIVAFIVFLKSSIFNIKEIMVTIDNNSTLTESEIIELSNIAVRQNMYSISKKASIENLKTNSYVESVNIKRKIPNKIVIKVVEREIAFQIETSNGYIYIDNQGVVVDQQSVKKDCITVVGCKTQNIISGDKLNDDDIKGLSDVMVIIQEAKNNEVIDEITKIDISNHDDYLVYFENQGKVAHIGDIGSINDKMTRIAKILKVESEVEGEIFVNVDFNNGKYPYFREKV